MPIIEPFSDIVSALSNLRLLVRSLIADIEAAKSNAMTASIRQNLRYIRFTDEGTIGPLKAYLRENDPSLLADLNSRLGVSRAMSRTAKHDLERLADSLGDLSLGKLEKLEQILNMKFATGGIRMSVEVLAATTSFDAMTSEELKKNIEVIVDAMEKFNASVKELHDSLT